MKKKTKKTLWIVGIVFLVVAIGLLLYFTGVLQQSFLQTEKHTIITDPVCDINDKCVSYSTSKSYIERSWQTQSSFRPLKST